MKKFDLSPLLIRLQLFVAQMRTRFRQFADRLVPTLDAWTTRLIKFHAGHGKQGRDAYSYVRPIARVGTLAASAMFAVFLIWSFLAPLHSAAVAHGVIVPASNKKTIQHLEGGIIEEIFVRNGDYVKAGEPLLRLSKTTAEVSQEILQNQLYTAKAIEERLLTEQTGKEKLAFSEEIRRAAKTYPKLGEILETQLQLFESRQLKNTGQTDIIRQRIAQLEEEIQGLEAQLTAATEQIGLIAEEMTAVEKLVEKRYAPKPRLLALQRQHTELLGRQGEYRAAIARARQSIIENELQIHTIRNEFMETVVDELREAQNRVAETEEKIKAATDTLERVLITAPQSGVVTGMKFFTLGGVVPPGEPIMDIVPQEDRLVIDAQVQPLDIDVVHKGLPADVRLSAFRARFVPPLEGEVEYVSPDRFTDEQTGHNYYVARVTVDQDELQQLADSIRLYPGMPVEVLIITGRRSFISYLFDPLTRSFNRAFREE